MPKHAPPVGTLATQSSSVQRAIRLIAELRASFLLYFAISFAALAVDFLTFTGLVSGWGLRPALAATIGWCIGLATHYLLARKMLYRNTMPDGSLLERVRRFLLYSSPSFAGLALTIIVVELGIWMGLTPALAKAIAAVLSFQLAFVVRSLMFGRSRTPAA